MPQFLMPKAEPDLFDSILLDEGTWFLWSISNAELLAYGMFRSQEEAREFRDNHLPHFSVAMLRHKDEVLLLQAEG